MALYIPHSIFHLARLLYVRPENFGPYYVCIDGLMGGCLVVIVFRYVSDSTGNSPVGRDGDSGGIDDRIWRR